MKEGGDDMKEGEDDIRKIGMTLTKKGWLE
jgi:hypothetical protein